MKPDQTTTSQGCLYCKCKLLHRHPQESVKRNNNMFPNLPNHQRCLPIKKKNIFPVTVLNHGNRQAASLNILFASSSLMSKVPPRIGPDFLCQILQNKPQLFRRDRNAKQPPGPPGFRQIDTTATMYQR